MTIFRATCPRSLFSYDDLIITNMFASLVARISIHRLESRREKETKNESQNNMQDQKIKVWNLPPAAVQKWPSFTRLICLIFEPKYDLILDIFPFLACLLSFNSWWINS